MSSSVTVDSSPSDRLVISALVNLKYQASPMLPTLPVVDLQVALDRNQTFFYPAWSKGNPLVYSLGQPCKSPQDLLCTLSAPQSWYISLQLSASFFLFLLPCAADYQSSQAGHPQGLDVNPITGRVSWNTSLVSPGSYSAQLVVQDTFSEVNVSMSLPHPFHKFIHAYVGTYAVHYKVYCMYVGFKENLNLIRIPCELMIKL